MYGFLAKFHPIYEDVSNHTCHDFNAHVNNTKIHKRMHATMHHDWLPTLNVYTFQWLSRFTRQDSFYNIIGFPLILPGAVIYNIYIYIFIYIVSVRESELVFTPRTCMYGTRPISVDTQFLCYQCSTLSSNKQVYWVEVSVEKKCMIYQLVHHRFIQSFMSKFA